MLNVTFFDRFSENFQLEAPVQIFQNNLAKFVIFVIFVDSPLYKQGLLQKTTESLKIT